MAKSDKLNPSQQIILAAYHTRRKRAPRAIFSPMAAISAKCLDCAGNSRQGVKDCDILRCPLWVFRNGKHDATVELSSEQRNSLSVLAAEVGGA